MRRIVTTCTSMVWLLSVVGQESMLKEIEDSLPAKQKVTAAFKSTRVINAHSMETLAKGNLDFRILHRFGRINSGVGQWFGLDDATMRMALEYGMTDHVMVGIGRSTHRKEIDAFAKTRLLQQSTGTQFSPISLLVAGGVMWWTGQAFDTLKPTSSDRTSYYLQLVAGRKFNEFFSFQLSPILVHRNRVYNLNEDNTIFAIGAGARYKLSKRVAVTVDYHHPLSRLPEANTDPLSVGVDIETGGHVFQLHFSNAIGMNERSYITETTENFFNGDIRFGFNLSRIFALHKKKQ